MSEPKITIPQSSPLFARVLEMLAAETAPAPPTLPLTAPCIKCGRGFHEHYFHSNEYRCPV